MKDEFLATVSHELRTPLNAMLGWSHVLRDPKVTSPVMHQAADAIERNAQIQARLIEDILDVSRIVTGKLRLDPRPTDLTAIVLSAVDVVRPSADAKGIAMHVQAPPAAPLIGDSDRLRQVVWNILSNAVKFTPRGGVWTSPCPSFAASTASRSRTPAGACLPSSCRTCFSHSGRWMAHRRAATAGSGSDLRLPAT